MIMIRTHLPIHRLHTLVRLGLALALPALSACESAFDVSLSADPPDTEQRVTLPLDGLTLRRTDGQVIALDFDDPIAVDLLQFDFDRPYGLIVNRSVDEGDYNGLQLRLDGEGAELQALDGGVFPIETTTTSGFAPLAFRIEDDRNIALELALDLRLSLARLNDDRYRLRPVLRAIRAGEGAILQGEVSPLLLAGPDCGLGAAVYLFEGPDVEPDERDGVAAEPYATAPVQIQQAPAFYRIGVLPAGTYTVALTCDGEFEDGADLADPTLDFVGTPVNVELRAGQVGTLNLSP